MYTWRNHQTHLTSNLTFYQLLVDVIMRGISRMKGYKCHVSGFRDITAKLCAFKINIRLISLLFFCVIRWITNEKCIVQIFLHTNRRNQQQQEVSNNDNTRHTHWRTNWLYVWLSGNIIIKYAYELHICTPLKAIHSNHCTVPIKILRKVKIDWRCQKWLGYYRVINFECYNTWNLMNLDPTYSELYTPHVYVLPDGRV